MISFKTLINKIPHKRRNLLNAIVFAVVCIGVVLAALWAWNQYRTTAPYVNPDRYPIRGIDVSAHNGMMNLQAVADAGYKFVFIKASEGEKFRDENFVLNYDKARQAGLRTGAYHFYRFDCDPELQAHNLHKAVGGRYLDLGVAIDVEEHGNPSGYSAKDVSKGVAQMAATLERMGYHVLIYTNRDGYQDYVAPNKELKQYSIWICSFYQDPLSAPWEFWQYDHHGKVPGIRGDVDLNTYCGSEKDWENLFPGEHEPEIQ